MASMRCSSLIALCLIVGGCFNPEDGPGADGTETETETETGSGGATETTTGPSTTATSTESSTSATSPSTTDDTTSTASTTAGEVDSDSETDDPTGEEACGNGEPDADEACDDGINDGSYGGCAEDCTALGPHCGDAEVNGNEDCDDGTNANGGACSVGCVLPGTVVGGHNEEPVTFCDGEFLTRPAFRDNGNVLVGASGYCAEDSLVLLEVSPEVDVVQDFGDLLLPETPVQEGIVVGDRWVLAENGCNYVISAAGALTEVCETRNHGTGDLAAVDDSTYYALNFNGLARYGMGSPALGDSPEWEVLEPTGTFTYSFNAMARGPSNAAVIAGSRTFNADSLGYLAIYSAGGNLADDTTTGVVTSFGELATGPMGHAAAGQPVDRIVRFGPNLGVQWDVLVPANDTPSLAIDSLGNVIAAYPISGGGVQVRKLGPDSSLVWTLDLAPSRQARVAVDAQDQIWMSSIDVGMGALAFGLRKIAP